MHLMITIYFLMGISALQAQYEFHGFPEKISEPESEKANGNQPSQRHPANKKYPAAIPAFCSLIGVVNCCLSCRYQEFDIKRCAPCTLLKSCSESHKKTLMCRYEGASLSIQLENSLEKRFFLEFFQYMQSLNFVASDRHAFGATSNPQVMTILHFFSKNTKQILNHQKTDLTESLMEKIKKLPSTKSLNYDAIEISIDNHLTELRHQALLGKLNLEHGVKLLQIALKPFPNSKKVLDIMNNINTYGLTGY